MLSEEMTRGKFTGLIHCFSSTRKLAETALSLGFFISISGIVTFKKSDELRAIVADVPLDRLLVETDSPYLAPAPFRGKLNQPAYVRHVAEEIARLRGITVEAVAAATSGGSTSSSAVVAIVVAVVVVAGIAVAVVIRRRGRTVEED